MRRCLFIDDSSVVLKIATHILNGPDMVVTTAQSAQAALDMCAVDMPDIIVLDAHLSDMMTADFLEQLHAIRSAIAPRVLLNMIAFDVGCYMRARRLGVHGYLQKPFNRTQLLTAFREMALDSATAA